LVQEFGFFSFQSDNENGVSFYFITVVWYLYWNCFVHLNNHFNCWLCTWLLNQSWAGFSFASVQIHAYLSTAHAQSGWPESNFLNGFYRAHFCMQVHGDVMCIEFNVINILSEWLSATWPTRLLSKLTIFIAILSIPLCF
jgi:hypothetical protein